MFDEEKIRRFVVPSTMDSDPDSPITLRFLQEILKRQGSICLLDESTGNGDGTHINSMIEAFFKHNKDEINKRVKFNQDHSKHKE